MSKKKRKPKRVSQQIPPQSAPETTPKESWAMKISIAGWIVFLICLTVATFLMATTIPKGDAVPSIKILTILQWTGAIAAIVAITALFRAKKSDKIHEGNTSQV